MAGLSHTQRGAAAESYGSNCPALQLPDGGKGKAPSAIWPSDPAVQFEELFLHAQNRVRIFSPFKDLVGLPPTFRNPYLPKLARVDSVVHNEETRPTYPLSLESSHSARNPSPHLPAPGYLLVILPGSAQAALLWGGLPSLPSPRWDFSVTCHQVLPCL